MPITDEMVEAGCNVQHSPRAWGRALRNPVMAAWVQSHREIMRRILTAAIEAGDRDPNEIWEEYLQQQNPDFRSEQAALAFGYAVGRP